MSCQHEHVGVTETRGTWEESRRPLTAEVVLFTAEGRTTPRLQALLAKRTMPPFDGRWELPGGPVLRNEGLAGAAAHRLAESTGIRDVFLRQVVAVGTPGRDPRADAVSVLHVGLVRMGVERAPVSPDARVLEWFDVDARLPPLAFDHSALLEDARESLRARLGESTDVFDLLPSEFTLGDLQALCESILARALDRRNFRRKVLGLGILSKGKGMRQDGPHRPAQLFRLDAKGFARWSKRSRALPFR